jgi:hypothetical protein
MDLILPESDQERRDEAEKEQCWRAIEGEM